MKLNHRYSTERREGRGGKQHNERRSSIEKMGRNVFASRVLMYHTEGFV